MNEPIGPLRPVLAGREGLIFLSVTIRIDP